MADQSKKGADSLYNSLASKYKSAKSTLRKISPSSGEEPVQMKLMFGPFDQEDLAPGSDEEVRFDDVSFVGIGSPKCGTRWWQSLILQHPEVVPNVLGNISNDPVIELDYFPHFGYQGITETEKKVYRSAFRRREGKVCGEFTTIYLNHPHCIEYLAETAPDTKILLVLRSPVDRTISHVNHLLLNRAKVLDVKPERMNFFETHSAIPEAYFYSHYLLGLKRLLKSFKRENILLLQYEKCKDDPIAEIQKTYKFLEIDPSFSPAEVTKSVNRQAYIIDKPEQNIRNRIRDYFLDEVLEIKTLFPELDLDFWEEFSSG